MTTEIARFLGNMIEEVQEVDEGKYGDCVGKYICVRVVINVDEPLRRILRVDVMRDGKQTTTLLQYERLPNYCYRCRRLGHVVRECLVDNAKPEDLNLMYGAWLNAFSSIKSGQVRSKKDGAKAGERSGVRANPGNNLAGN
ncbi:hypothetical protein Dsin_013686 [Dipteronia sinensis]|uniref:CCHC-type domain-containing protein n=1 Tax=Dipteronia sinensis TaxID=43782 RepID=A0AAE0AKD2_9ROSI|nr:hypothetical protein Dsin_013686 [Dipteronia sinensis]